MAFNIIIQNLVKFNCTWIGCDESNLRISLVPLGSLMFIVVIQSESGLGSGTGFSAKRCLRCNFAFIKYLGTVFLISNSSWFRSSASFIRSCSSFSLLILCAFNYTSKPPFLYQRVMIFHKLHLAGF